MAAADPEEAVDPTIAGLANLTSSWNQVGFAPGWGVAVVRDGRVIYAEGFGTADLATGQPVSPETRFYIASTSKSFLALTAAVLDEQDRIDLDLPVTKYLPDLAFRSPADAGTVTLRDLLGLTHGLEDGGPVVFRTAFSGEHSPSQLIRLLADYGPGEQGRTFNYGNLGYNIAAMALEEATGEDWKSLVAKTVLEPTGMHSTTACPSRVAPDALAMPHKTTPTGSERIHMGKVDATMHAAGGHVATMEDLGRWIAVNLGRGKIDGKQVLPASAFDTTHRQHAEQDRKFGAYHRHGWGLGWDLATYDGEALITRFGSYGGFRSHLSFMPDRGIGVAVQVNDGQLGAMMADQIANSIYDHLLGKTDAAEATLERANMMAARGRQGLGQELAKRRARPQVMALGHDAYTGSYENEAWGRMEWRLEDAQLCVVMGAARSCAEVYDGAKHQLRVELTGSGEIVTFMADGDSIVAATYSGARFERVLK